MRVRDPRCRSSSSSTTTIAPLSTDAAALRYLRAGGATDVFNCGYSKGYSVLQVIDGIKRVSGKTFDVRLSPRRPGDPAQIVAASDKIRRGLGWSPAHDDLDRIIAHALAWEAQLGTRMSAA